MPAASVPRLLRFELNLMTAHLVALRSTCERRSVGCVLADQLNSILSTGYNGPARGLPLCRDNPRYRTCTSADSESGKNIIGCYAVHAEQNAILRLGPRDPKEVYWVYCTTQPCESCLKLIMGTGAVKIVFSEPYSQSKEMKQLIETFESQSADHQISAFCKDMLPWRSVSPSNTTP